MTRRFLYFLPGLGGANPRMLGDRGILSRFTAGRGGQIIEHGVTTTEGPIGNGCIVAAGGRPARYDPAKQHWIAIQAGAGEGMRPASAWVALEDPALPPGPADLERTQGVNGYGVTLGDGLDWRVPLLRRWDDQKLEHVPALPQSIGGQRGEDGRYRFVSKVRPEFADLDSRAEGLFEGFLSGRRIGVDQLMRDAAELLAVNYRLGVEELVLLGLLTEAMALDVLALSIDTPGLRQCARRIGAAGLVARQTAEPREESGRWPVASGQSDQSSLATGHG